MTSTTTPSPTPRTGPQRPPARPRRLSWFDRPRVVLGAVVAAGAVLVALWMDARPWGARTVNLSTRLGAASGLSALMGTLLLSITVVFSARIRWIEGAVGGLDRVYRFHHRLGALAFSLLAVHPVFLAWRSARVSWDRAAGLWWPTAGDWALVAGQLALYGMAVGMIITLYLAVRHQVLVWTQRWLGALLLPAAYHVWFIGGDVGRSPALRLYIGAFLAAGIAALGYHTALGRFTAPHRRYVVTAVTPLPGSVTELRLRPAGRPVRFAPGQFAYLRLHHAPLGGSQRDGAIGGEPHPFSIASPPDSEELRFTIKDLGDFTHRIHDLLPGAEATVEGPYGRFSASFIDGDDQVWVAGGIGIAPFLSMASALPLPERPELGATLFYAFPDADRAPFLDELRHLALTNPALEVRLLDERVDGVPTVELIAGAVGDLTAREFLLCGPPPMMHALRDQLLGAGVPAQRIHFEEFDYA